MRCFISSSSAPKSRGNTLGIIMWNGSVVLACSLAIAGVGWVDAARTPQQRQDLGRNPYMILPPGLQNGIEADKPAQDLGARTFVSGDREKIGNGG